MVDITAKLAEVITPTQLAFNAGSGSGVKSGHTVTLWRNVAIQDPDTKEPLGTVRIPRLVLRVNYVQEKFCIADVVSTDVDNPTNSGANAIPSFGRAVKVTTEQPRLGMAKVVIGEEASIRVQEPASK